jgi:hypothetical protein
LNAHTGRPRCPAAPRAATLCLRFVDPRPDNNSRSGRYNHRGVAVSSIAYLPQTFMTLFFLAASLLLGLMRR